MSNLYSKILLSVGLFWTEKLDNPNSGKANLEAAMKLHDSESGYFTSVLSCLANAGKDLSLNRKVHFFDIAIDAMSFLKKSNFILTTEETENFYKQLISNCMNGRYETIAFKYINNEGETKPMSLIVR